MCLRFPPWPCSTPVSQLLQLGDAFAARWFPCEHAPQFLGGGNPGRHLLVTQVQMKSIPVGSLGVRACCHWTREPVGEPGRAARGLRSAQLSLGLTPASLWLWVDIFQVSCAFTLESSPKHHKTLCAKGLLVAGIAYVSFCKRYRTQ